MFFTLWFTAKLSRSPTAPAKGTTFSFCVLPVVQMLFLAFARVSFWHLSNFMFAAKAAPTKTFAAKTEPVNR